MSKLDNMLSKITEEYAQGMRMRCDNCGKITEIQDEGRGPLLCCDKKMIVMAQYAPKTESGFNKYPRGWDNDSVKKFGKTLSKRMKGGVKSKGFFDKCVKKMRGKVENPEGFCAGVKDETYGSTGWRGKGKSPAKVKADTKKLKFKINEQIENILEYEEAYFILQCDKENDRIEDKLLCLKKAYILCGANRVCQQRIDRFYDAITGNFEGSGEAPLQTDPQLPVIQVSDPQMSRREELNQIMELDPLRAVGAAAVGLYAYKATGKLAKSLQRKKRCKDKYGKNPKRLKACLDGGGVKEELDHIMELDPVSGAAGAISATAALTAGSLIKLYRAKKACEKKYGKNPKRLKACMAGVSARNSG